VLTDGTHLLVGCESGDIRVLDLASGAELKNVRAHQGACGCVAPLRACGHQ